MEHLSQDSIAYKNNIILNDKKFSKVLHTFTDLSEEPERTFGIPVVFNTARE
jgi:hypothetical protein